jgi:hypothetical protein
MQGVTSWLGPNAMLVGQRLQSAEANLDVLTDCS